MELQEVVKVLEKYAPKKLAADWDNVGLLLEPSNHVVNKIMLTNDLTIKVLEEAIESNTNMLISYHPPIFKAFKRLGQKEWKEQIVVKCLENKIALYSPHTAWDCVRGGVNDWLVQPFVGSVKVLQPIGAEELYKVEVGREEVSKRGDCKEIEGIKWSESPTGSLTSTCSAPEAQMVCGVLSGANITCQRLVAFPNQSMGYGRVVTLDQPISIKEIILKVKKHIGIQNLQLALATDATEDTLVKTVAVCAGSGASVLRGACAEVYITGEMGHHELLDCTTSTGGCATSVVLCNHSNSERGFLSGVMKDYLEEELQGKVRVLVSQQDKDPLQAV